MDAPVLLLAALWCVGIPALVFGAATALGYDWHKRSDYGLTKAPAPPLWQLLLFSFVLAIVVLVGWLSAGAPAT